MAELVDAADLKSVVRKDVPVRFRPSAPSTYDPQYGDFFYITFIFAHILMMNRLELVVEPTFVGSNPKS